METDALVCIYKSENGKGLNFQLQIAANYAREQIQNSRARSGQGDYRQHKKARYENFASTLEDFPGERPLFSRIWDIHGFLYIINTTIIIML